MRLAIPEAKRWKIARWVVIINVRNRKKTSEIFEHEVSLKYFRTKSHPAAVRPLEVGARASSEKSTFEKFVAIVFEVVPPIRLLQIGDWEREGCVILQSAKLLRIEMLSTTA
jgi:hypothetical protein